MSIFITLDRLENEGKLVRYLPPGTARPVRELYIAAPLFIELGDRRSSFHFFGQIPAVQLLFELWVTGGMISVRTGSRRGDAGLARLEPPPDEIWELRVTRTRPQVRIFGRFAAPDVLIATTVRNRDHLGRAAAGKRQVRAWSEAMYDCFAEWNRIFGGEPAFRGEGAADYVRSNRL